MQNLIRRTALALFVASLVASCAGHGEKPPTSTPAPFRTPVSPLPSIPPPQHDA